MKNSSLFILLAVLFLFITCEKNKDNDEIKCRLVQYGTLKNLPGEYTQSVFYSEDGLFLRYNYSIKSNHGNSPDTIDKTLVGIDSIVYDGSFVYRIFYKDAKGRVNKFYEFENDGINLISRVEFTSGANFISFAKEFFEFTEENRLSEAKLVKFYTSTFENPVDTAITYYIFDESGNLIKSVCVDEYMQGNQFISDSIIKEYKAYDNKINPFCGWPFPDMQDKCLSRNNWTKSKFIHKVNGADQIMGNSEQLFEYDINNYPLIGEYDCDYQ